MHSSLNHPLWKHIKASGLSLSLYIYIYIWDQLKTLWSDIFHETNRYAKPTVHFIFKYKFLIKEETMKSGINDQYWREKGTINLYWMKLE